MRLMLCSLLVAGLPLAAQQVPTRALTRADAEYAEPFDQIYALRELSDGRLLVTDLGPKAVLLVDFRQGTPVTVGRNGQGPGEYQFPGDLLPFRGDSALLVDRVSRRLLVVSPDGKVGRSIPYPEGVGGVPDTRGADGKGRVYLQASPFGGGPGRFEIGGALPDTVPLLRWDMASGKVDTIARVKVQSVKVQTSGTQNNRTVMVRSQPFAETDDWAVLADGRVAIARVGNFHMELAGAGAPVSGAQVPYERLKVGAADKDAYLATMRSSRNRITVTAGGGGGGGASSSRQQSPPEVTAADFDWPEYKPPFAARGLQATPEGDLWLVRSTSARDSTPVVDVFNGQGVRTGRVTLPLGRRVVGVGRGVVYAVRTDEDGLQWLERYRR